MSNLSYSHFYTVPPEVPDQIRPLMAIFTSYFLRTNKSKVQHNGEYVKRVRPMIWRLLCFFHPEYEVDKKWRRVFPPEWRKGELIKKVTKADGSIMTPEEQIDYFIHAAHQKGNIIYCSLLENKHTVTFHGIENPKAIQIVVIMKEDGKCIATSRSKGNRIKWSKIT